jgi:Cu(I)/Ag(I) efflux system membrane protein CusA/SilA
LAENLGQGRYIEIDIYREKAARFGLTISDAQLFVSQAIGGMSISETVEGVARYPINIRYPQSFRDSPHALKRLPILTDMGALITLGEIARISVRKGPSMLKSENGRPTVYVYLDIRDRDIQGIADDLREKIGRDLKVPGGVSVTLTGQYEAMERAKARLKLMIPLTLIIILALLYSEFKNFTDTLMIMGSLPFALAGGVFFMYLNDYALSVASGVGFIALSGLAAEFGVVMLLYLRESTNQTLDLKNPSSITKEKIDEVIFAGAVLRVRPKAMTVGTIVISLIPIFWSDGSGSEVMKRISAPLFGGMVTAFTLSMFILPAAWKLKLYFLRCLSLKEKNST